MYVNHEFLFYATKVSLFERIVQYKKFYSLYLCNVKRKKHLKTVRLQIFKENTSNENTQIG